MKNLIKIIEAASKLPPHVTSMLTHTVPWIAALAIVATVLHSVTSQGG